MKVLSTPQSMRVIVLILLFFVFIIIGIVRALIFKSQIIIWETCTLGDHNIELYLPIKNPVYLVH